MNIAIMTLSFVTVTQRMTWELHKAGFDTRGLYAAVSPSTLAFVTTKHDCFARSAQWYCGQRFVDLDLFLAPQRHLLICENAVTLSDTLLMFYIFFALGIIL